MYIPVRGRGSPSKYNAFFWCTFRQVSKKHLQNHSHSMDGSNLKNFKNEYLLTISLPRKMDKSFVFGLKPIYPMRSGNVIGPHFLSLRVQKYRFLAKIKIKIFDFESIFMEN